MARREAREYREYLSAEQRSQPGCPARELCREPRGQDTRNCWTNSEYLTVNSQLRVARRALDEMIAAARAAEPAECCGVLLGTPGSIAEAAPTRNLAGDPNR